MTGFGDAAEQADGVSWTVDIRSLNNRYFKGTLRLPESVAALEAEVETLLRRKLDHTDAFASCDGCAERSSGE